MVKNRVYLSRRELVRGTASAALLSQLPGTAIASNAYDVVIIGAGLSGLASGLLLEQAGLRVKVIEGRNRVGGRVLSYRTLPGSPEAGGTSFGPGYARLIDMATKLGVGLISLGPVLRYYGKRELFLDSQHISPQDWVDHKRNPFSSDARQTLPWQFLGRFLGEVNPLLTADEWRDERNSSLDVSLHDFLLSQGLSAETIAMAYNIEPTHGNSAHDVSALMMLFVTSFINAQRALTKPGQSPFMTAAGGNLSIPEAMAGALKGEIEFGRNVIGIRNAGASAEVYCDDGRIFKAKRVICSVPCSVLRRIKMDPVLTGAQAKAVQTLDSQIINQAHMVAKTPFWEKDGLSTNMFSDGLVCSLVGEHKSENPSEVSSITAWVRGNKAAWLDQLPPMEAKRAIIDDIEKHRPAAKGQLEIVEYKSWYRDPYSSGDWAIWKPGQVSDFANVIGRANGRIHFCGEHTAVSNRGMEGAMESGERVAMEVLSSI